MSSPLNVSDVDCRRIDELEKTVASMRKSLGEYNPAKSSTTTLNSTETTGFGSNFGHPLDMLARTAADTHCPDVDRLNTSFNGITPPAGQNISRQQPLRIGPSEAIPTTWSTELTGIDPVERGWLDIDDAKWLFERYPNRFLVLISDSGNICFHVCQLFHSVSPLISNK